MNDKDKSYITFRKKKTEKEIATHGSPDIFYEINDINPMANANELSLKMIERLMPSYDGSGDVRDYLRSIDTLYNRCPENQREYFLLLAKYNLKGSARGLIEGQTIENYQNFHTSMGNLFRPDNVSIVSQDEFTQCKQGKDESVQDFAARVQIAKRRLVDQLPANQVAAGVQIFEAQALNIFVSGLRPNLKQIVKFRNVQHFEEAVRIAKTEESSEKLNKKDEQDELKCAWCKKSDHTASNCIDLARSSMLRDPNRQNNIPQYRENFFHTQYSNNRAQNYFPNRPPFRNFLPQNQNNFHTYPNNQNRNFPTQNYNNSHNNIRLNAPSRQNNWQNNFHTNNNKQNPTINQLLGIIDQLSQKIENLSTNNTNVPLQANDQQNTVTLNEDTLNYVDPDLPAEFWENQNQMAD